MPEPIGDMRDDHVLVSENILSIAKCVVMMEAT